MEWLGANAADFILAIGDDWTDEDLFRALPATAFSVRVGLANTAARYHLSSHTAVRRILRELSVAVREQPNGIRAKPEPPVEDDPAPPLAA
jgi:trehalose-6-phosphatase